MQLMWKQRYLLAMSVPFVIWLIVFKYLPLWGWTMAFQEVKPNSFALPVWERKFVGFDNFIQAFTDRLFPQTMINTIGISILGIAIGTLSSIFFALVLNEIRFTRFKKITQTVSYLPHFVSWVIIASIAKMLLNDGGAVDTMLNTKLHLMSTNSPMFWIVVCLINVWKEMGWDAIIYLSAPVAAFRQWPMCDCWLSPARYTHRASTGRWSVPTQNRRERATEICF